ncbi:helix-turn-helix domain-containing protein [Ekhidna sp.]|uniref:helix-turn-helix domain-containing protein n=1 Tax=Ekhidna sp. TaxID=2608089 RepID=UPI003B5094CB
MISDNDILKLILGFKVKHLRSKVGISYQALSDQTGLSVSYLNDIEKGKKYPKPDKIRALAKAFEVTYDELVSTQADKKLRPVVELLNSGFFKYFPTEEFGLNLEKVIDIFSNAPDKISAFISTILKMVRSYQIEKEHFYRVALRSYQDMHDNYFQSLESAAADFRKSAGIKSITPSLSTLKKLLAKNYAIQIDEVRLGEHKMLQRIRSFYSTEKRTLYLNNQLSDEQQKFVIAKEIGFQHLALAERPFETTLNKEASFEKLLNNFKASYFGAAFLMDADELVNDIKEMALSTAWSPNHIERLIKKYQVTPETLLQRLTNILPKHFGIDDLFFIRLDSTKGLVNYRITKELHLSGLHQPYQNQLEEHLCHRWVSISSIKQLNGSKSDHVVDAQVSEYWQSNNAYFCISIAEPSRFDNQNGTSVTIGLSMTDTLKGAFNFMKDDGLRRRTVHTTCEQCSISDCEHRVAPPTIVNKRNLEEELEEELKKL